MNKPIQVVYIASLVRSGSTFLQRQLCTYDSFSGIGEVCTNYARFVEDRQPQLAERICSCGKTSLECPVWGPIIPMYGKYSASEIHIAALKQIANQYPGRTIIDNSKEPYFLEDYYLKNPSDEVDLKVVFLVRDYRGWIQSIQKYRGQGGLRYSYLAEAYRWLRSNRNYLKLLRSYETNFMFVQYENYIFKQQAQRERLGNFLGVDLSENPEFANSSCHELGGSPTVRNKPQWSSQIKYDHSWISNRKHALCGPLCAPVVTWNAASYDMGMKTQNHEEGIDR